MTDTRVVIGGNARPEVTLRSPSAIPSVVSRPVPIGTPGTSVAPATETDQLLRALDIQAARLGDTAGKIAKEGQEVDLKEGQQARTENQLEWSEAVAQGKVSPTANPWFIKGYHTQDGSVAGLRLQSDMRSAYAQSPAKGSDDPKVFAQWQADFTKQWMEANGKDKSTEWWEGFRPASMAAQAQITAEHAQHAEQAVIAKQEANTGAEINVILNGTRDPAQAGAALMALKGRMKLMGMPEQSFDRVAAEAILAKAKQGDAGMLEALKHVKTGDSGTLASNPKVAAAVVDTTNAIKEQARADTRWAWAVQDRQFTLQSQQHAKESWAREKDRWTREDQTWDRQNRARSLTTQIILGTMANPGDYRNATKDDLARLATIDPAAMESVAGFQERFTARQEKVPDSVERPIIAQLQQDIIKAAGNPTLQQQIQLQAAKLFNDNRINKDTMFRAIDDARHFWSLDPSAQKKLQDPQVERVRSAARQSFTAEDKFSPYGTAALDALAVEQVIDKAVMDHLRANPNADGFALGQVASKALQAVLPATGMPGVEKTLGNVSTLGKAAATANAKVASEPGNPPKPPVTAAQVVPNISQADRTEFLRQANEAQQQGPVAFLEFISAFDQRVGLPGLGKAIIEQVNKPPEPPKPKDEGFWPFYRSGVQAK